MLRISTSIFSAIIKRSYVLSSKRNDDTLSSEAASIRSDGKGESNRNTPSEEFIEAQAVSAKMVRDLVARYGPIDFDAIEPIPLDWQHLPVDDFDDKGKTIDPHSALQFEQANRSFKTFRSNSSKTGGTFVPGDLALLNFAELGRKARPVLILSSVQHNGLQNARLLVVPFSASVRNTALHRFIIVPSDSLYGSLITNECNLLFDFSTLTYAKDLKATGDRLQKDSTLRVLDWWRWCVQSILIDFDTNREESQ